MSDFQVTVKEVNDVVVIATEGYLNNIGGEKISEVCDEHMDKGKNKFLINLEKSTVVNSIGVSILIEIIEKLQDEEWEEILLLYLLYQNLRHRDLGDEQRLQLSQWNHQQFSLQ